jgi:hypothetical protein
VSETGKVHSLSVFPDIIVHSRGKRMNLVIEVKKTTSERPVEYDHAKLRSFRKELKYQCALFLTFSAGSPPPHLVTALWFNDVGSEIDTSTDTRFDSDGE